MFTEAAVTKLRKVAINILEPPDEGKDHVDPPPKITGIAPKQGPVGGGKEVTITGEAFSSGPKVTFDGVEAKVTKSSQTSISVTTPPHKSGKVDVAVINKDKLQVVEKDGFEYLAAEGETPDKKEPPTITALSSASGGIAGGESVTITGINFAKDPKTTVLFGDTPAAKVQVNGPTSIVVDTPPHVAGAFEVKVKNPDGQEAVSSDRYTFD